MSWLLGRKLKLSIENTLLLYKCIIKPIRTYGIQPWGCTNPSNTKIIRRLRSKFLRSVTKERCYDSIFTIHNELQIQFGIEEIHRVSTLYHRSILGHSNRLVEISNPANVRVVVVVVVVVVGVVDCEDLVCLIVICEVCRPVRA
jgi:hypothetical protein